MTTLFRILMDTAGLSLAQASAFLDARQDSVMSWSSGRRSTPPGVTAELHGLISRQHRAAQEAVKIIKKHSTAAEIEIGIAVDDHEAQSLGWPCVGAHAAVIGMTVAQLPSDLAARVVVVSRGTSAATAAAADAH